MINAVSSFGAHTRMSDADYCGVLVMGSHGWRVAVNPDGTRYALQVPDGELWAGTSYSRLANLLNKNADLYDGLTERCECLPDDPFEARPDLRKRRLAVLRSFEASDTSEKRHHAARKGGRGRKSEGAAGSLPERDFWRATGVKPPTAARLRKPKVSGS